MWFKVLDPHWSARSEPRVTRCVIYPRGRGGASPSFGPECRLVSSRRSAGGDHVTAPRRTAAGRTVDDSVVRRSDPRHQRRPKGRRRTVKRLPVRFFVFFLGVRMEYTRRWDFFFFFFADYSQHIFTFVFICGRVLKVWSSSRESFFFLFFLLFFIYMWNQGLDNDARLSSKKVMHVFKTFFFFFGTALRCRRSVNIQAAVCRTADQTTDDYLISLIDRREPFFSVLRVNSASGGASRSRCYDVTAVTGGTRRACWEILHWGGILLANLFSTSGYILIFLASFLFLFFF